LTSAVGGHVTVAFNSTKPIIDDLRRFAIMRNIGDLALLSIYFHEMFMKRVIMAGLPPQSQGTPLSDKQKVCVLWAAHGYTSRQIASAFCISERMVDIHLSQARSKLGAANRHETTAKAVAAGIIRLGTLPPAPHAETHRMSERRKAYRVVR
jgi:DNA-binding CsgD family transcriptional regulator